MTPKVSDQGVGLLTAIRAGDVPNSSPQESQDELMNLMTIMYIAIQATLNDPDDMSLVYGKLSKFQTVCWTRVIADQCHN